MQVNQNSLICMDLFTLFPYDFFNHSPQIKIAALRGEGFKGQLIFYEQQTNTMLLLNPEKNELQQIVLTDTLTKKISQQFLFKKTKYNFCSNFAFENSLILFPDSGEELQIVNLDTTRVYTISLPFTIDQVQLMSERLWLLTEKDTHAKYFLSNSSQDAEIPNLLTRIVSKATTGNHQLDLKKISTNSVPKRIYERLNGMFPDTFAVADLQTTRLAASLDLACLAVAQPAREQFPVSLYSYQRNLSVTKGLYVF